MVLAKSTEHNPLRSYGIPFSAVAEETLTIRVSSIFFRVVIPETDRKGMVVMYLKEKPWALC